jgi:hypothetical protein
LNSENNKIIKQIEIYNNHKKWFELNENKKSSSKATIMVSELETICDELDKNKLTLSNDLKSYEEYIHYIKDFLTVNDQHINNTIAYKADIDFLNLYINMTSLSGIPLIIINNMLKIMEIGCNELLQHIADFTISFDIIKDNIYITKDFGGVCNSEQRMSGFEKFVINMSIRYAISECTNSSSTVFYASDEGFNALDERNLNLLDGVLDFMKHDNQFILLISHVNKIHDLCKNYLTINKISPFVSHIDNRNTKKINKHKF